MEVGSSDTSSTSTKTGLESLSKEELITKYKGLLNIAKKAKQAKDEFAAENALLKEALQRHDTQKEADKKALMTMKETLEQFTEQKLLLSTQLDELRQQNRQDNDLLSQLRIENESLRRQMDSLTTDNESLLNDIDAMENQLKQVNASGVEQKKQLDLLELELNRLKERESHTASIEQRLHVSLAENKALKEAENLSKKSLNELTEKYQHVKEINSQQRHKFNALKERFVDVLRKLKNLKECKSILLETQQEYAEAVSKWQNEIINGARQLCKQLHSLKAENDELVKQLKTMNANKNLKKENEITVTPVKSADDNCEFKLNIETFAAQLNDLENLANFALNEQSEQCLEKARLEAELLESKKNREEQEKSELTMTDMKSNEELLEKLKMSEAAFNETTQNYDQLKREFEAYESLNLKLQNDCEHFKALLRENESKSTASKEISATNEKLAADLSKLNEKLAEEKQQYEKLESEVEAFKLNKQANEKIAALQQKFDKLQARFTSQVAAHENNEQEQRMENERLKAQLQELSNEKARLIDEIKEKTDLTAEKIKMNEELIEKFKILETDIEELTQAHAQLKNQNLELQNECGNLRARLQAQEIKLNESAEIVDANSKLTLDLKNLTEKLAEKTLQHERLENELTAIQLNKQESEAAAAIQLESKALQTRLATQKQDCEKLLMEKSEIESKNQFLMEKLELQTTKLEYLESTQQANEMLKADLEQALQELQKYRQLYEELQARHELKEREHTDLLGEMRELNEALKKRGDLISRQEARQNELNAELKRLQQFEQALKEKEQLIQQKDDELKQINEEVKASQAKVEELTAACTRSEEQFHALTLELQSLRHSDLKDDAQSDAVSITSTMSRAESINQLRDVEETYEERYTKLKTLAMKLKKKLQEQTANANELSSQLKVQESALETQQKLNESLTAENKKLKTTRKQSNMLNLEIEAAEKSLNDVSAKLTAKSSELNELKVVLETKELTIVQLRKELAIVEAAKASECEHAKELKAQIDLLQSQIKDAVHSKQTTLDSNKDLEHAQELLKLEIEDLRLQLSQSESKQVLKVEALSVENSQLQAKLIEMESTLAATQQKLKTTERGLDELRVEHMEYKLKAQTVLRKQQTKDTTNERELEEELLNVRQQLQQMETLTQNLRQKLEASDKQLEILTEDNASLLQRKEELMSLVEELRLQNEALLQEQRTLLQAQQDALRQQRQQIESLDECHKAQIERLESNHQQQLAQLKAEFAKASTMRPAPLIGAVAKSTPPKIFSDTHETTAYLMEREDAEGSESANVVTLQSLAAAKRKISNASSSTRRRSLHELMPLDELLNAPMNALNTETIFSANNNLVSSYLNDGGSGGNSGLNMSNDSVEHLELQAAKERLQIQESRVRHLTALLAENEQDLAKLTQMNDMLKEELRRQERSVEREQHMHNSEYLKNVIIKFITLNSVDERTRLVPVLNTILKLSRAETEMLNCVAKGQKVTENQRSWSNFLPSWGGSGGGANNGN